MATLNGKSITSKLAMDTLCLAIKRTANTSPLILHSDYAEKNTIPKISSSNYQYCIHYNFFDIATLV